MENGELTAGQVLDRIGRILDRVPDAQNGAVLPPDIQAELELTLAKAREQGLLPRRGEALPPDEQAEVALILAELKVIRERRAPREE